MIIKNVNFKDSIPKLCVPIMPNDEEAMLHIIAMLKQHSFDVIEWRLDCYACVFEKEKVLKVAQLLRNAFPSQVILATFRTIYEGGKRFCREEDYALLYETLIKHEVVDMIDLEHQFAKQQQSALRKLAKEHKVGIVGSYHNFECTPEDTFLFCLAEEMCQEENDVIKFALMPQKESDVMRTMMFASMLFERHPKQLQLVISMGELGKITRICGETLHSCMTFGSMGQASAVGQIACEELKLMLNQYHQWIKKKGEGK